MIGLVGLEGLLQGDIRVSSMQIFGHANILRKGTAPFMAAAAAVTLINSLYGGRGRMSMDGATAAEEKRA